MRQKHIKEALQVTWARHVLGVELHAEERLRGVHNALVTLVVFVRKQRRPISRQRCVIDGETVILRRDETLACFGVRTRLIVPAVSIPAK